MIENDCMSTEIDVFEFTRSAQSRAASCPVLGLDRLSSLLADPSGQLTWRIDGWRERDPAGTERLRLRLAASATVGMRCGRCLGVVDLPLEIDRSYLLAASEKEADRLDEDEDEFDVLVASRRFDIEQLLEDEAILALPAVASHVECEPPGGRDEKRVDPPADADDKPKPSPFSVLAALKRNPST